MSYDSGPGSSLNEFEEVSSPFAIIYKMVLVRDSEYCVNGYFFVRLYDKLKKHGKYTKKTL